MLIGITNVAVVQIVQALVIIFWCLIMLAVVAARRHLPRTKIEPLIDVTMVVVLLIYAVILKIYFST